MLLIDLAELQRRGWLTAEEITPPAGLEQRLNFASVVYFRMARLPRRRGQRFAAQASAENAPICRPFCERHADWLPEHVLFMTLAEQHNWRDWSSWDAPLAARNRSRWPRRARFTPSASPSGPSASGASSASGWR